MSAQEDFQRCRVLRVPKLRVELLRLVFSSCSPILLLEFIESHHRRSARSPLCRVRYGRRGCPRQRGHLRAIPNRNLLLWFRLGLHLCKTGLVLCLCSQLCLVVLLRYALLLAVSHVHSYLFVFVIVFMIACPMEATLPSASISSPRTDSSLFMQSLKTMFGFFSAA